MRTGGWVAIGLGGVLALTASAGYWFATGGFDRERQPPAWLTARPIAHRGLHSGDSFRPENSLAAFRAAADAGYAIELDVHMTSDGCLVVMHDEDLARMTGVPKRISQTPASEVTALRLLDSAQTVPTLAQVLAAVGGRVPVLRRGQERRCRRTTGGRGRIAALGHARSGRCHLLQPPVPAPVSPTRRRRSPGASCPRTFAGEKLALWKKVLLGGMLMNWRSRPDFVAYQLEGLPAAGISLQKRRGRPLIVWTADTKDEFDRARTLGDAVMFELEARPDR